MDEDAALHGRTFNIDVKGPGAAALLQSVKAKLVDFMGSYSDDVLAEYVVVLVGHGKQFSQAAADLDAFLGEKTDIFMRWLWSHLAANKHLYAATTHPRQDLDTDNGSREEIEDDDLEAKDDGAPARSANALEAEPEEVETFLNERIKDDVQAQVVHGKAVESRSGQDWQRPKPEDEKGSRRTRHAEEQDGGLLHREQKPDGRSYYERGRDQQRDHGFSRERRHNDRYGRDRMDFDRRLDSRVGVNAAALERPFKEKGDMSRHGNADMHDHREYSRSRRGAHSASAQQDVVHARHQSHREHTEANGGTRRLARSMIQSVIQEQIKEQAMAGRDQRMADPAALSAKDQGEDDTVHAGRPLVQGGRGKVLRQWGRGQTKAPNLKRHRPIEPSVGDEMATDVPRVPSRESGMARTMNANLRLLQTAMRDAASQQNPNKRPRAAFSDDINEEEMLTAHHRDVASGDRAIYSVRDRLQSKSSRIFQSQDDSMQESADLSYGADGEELVKAVPIVRRRALWGRVNGLRSHLATDAELPVAEGKLVRKGRLASRLGSAANHGVSEQFLEQNISIVIENEKGMNKVHHNGHLHDTDMDLQADSLLEVSGLRNGIQSGRPQNRQRAKSRGSNRWHGEELSDLVGFKVPRRDSDRNLSQRLALPEREWRSALPLEEGKMGFPEQDGWPRGHGWVDGEDEENELCIVASHEDAEEEGILEQQQQQQQQAHGRPLWQNTWTGEGAKVAASEKMEALMRRLGSTPSEVNVPQDEAMETAEAPEDGSESVMAMKKRIRQVQLEMTKLRARQAEVAQKAPASAAGPLALTRAPSKEARDAASIFISNVHFAATAGGLTSHFGPCGPILRVTILTEPATGQPRGCAYIEFASVDAVEKALAFDNTAYLSRQLKVVRKSESSAASLAPVRKSLGTTPPIPRLVGPLPGMLARSASSLKWQRGDPVPKAEATAPPEGVAAGMPSSQKDTLSQSPGAAVQPQAGGIWPAKGANTSYHRLQGQIANPQAQPLMRSFSYVRTPAVSDAAAQQ